MACDELTAFMTATEALDQRIHRSSRLDRAMFWRNAIPMGVFIKNKGVTATTSTIKPSEPTDDDTLWDDITLVDGRPSPTCDATYEDMGVGFYNRTYGPKKRRLRGPVICKENLTYDHQPEAFLNAYVDEMGRYVARVWEFALRSDYMRMATWWSDYNKTSGPNARATVDCPTSDISFNQLELIAANLSNVGASVSDEKGYVMNGNDGPIYTLVIDQLAAQRIMRNDPVRRLDAQYASMGNGANGDLSLWKRLGANKVIGNFRYVTTDSAPRFNCVGGVLTPVSPYKSVADVTSDGQTHTAAYNTAEFEAAIVLVPTAMTAEVVTPTNWRWPDASNYTGDLQFIVGGERICDPPEYDPQHEKGRHFGEIVYAARPEKPFHAQVLVYKRCASDRNLITCLYYGDSPYYA